MDQASGESNEAQASRHETERYDDAVKASPGAGIDEATVIRIAKLARLGLAPAEREAMRTHLENILAHVNDLSALDTSDVPPTYHAIPLEAPFRMDVPTQSLCRDEVLRAAPASALGGIAVPKVLDV